MSRISTPDLVRARPSNGSTIIRASVSMAMFLLSLALFSSSALAVLSAITVNYPANNTEYFSTTMNLTITTNEAAGGCLFYNGTLAAPGTIPYELGNMSVANTTWNNTVLETTYVPAGDNSPYRNFTFVCNDTNIGGTASVTKTALFKINERAPNTLGYVPITISSSMQANGTEYFTKDIFINVSVNETVTSCTSYLNNSFTAGIALTMTNQSWMQNASDMSAQGPNNYAFRNFTIACQDAFGNVSWWNTSKTVGYYFFKINERASNTVGFTPILPTQPNGTEYFTRDIYVNFTTNVTVLNCSSYLNLNGPYEALTMSNQSWMQNASEMVKQNANNYVFRNISIMCQDVFGNTSWSNSSASAGGTYRFRINERAPDAIVITNRNPVNASLISVKPNVNITLNATATSCSYHYNYGAAVPLGNFSGVKTSWNKTGGTMADSAFGVLSNLTYTCQDIFGNVSWLNVTTTGFVYLDLDTTAPVVTATAYNSSRNYTGVTQAAYLNASFSITDNHPNSCGIEIYPEINSTKILYNITGRIIGTTASRNCSVAINGWLFEDLGRAGNFTLRGWADDTVAWSSYGVANETVIVTKLYAGKWNMITWFDERIYARNISNQIPKVTQIALFSNYLKTYTTWSSSTPNSNAALNFSGMGSLNYTMFVYVSNDTWVFQHDASGDMAMSRNVSLYSGGWSVLAANANRTLSSFLTDCTPATIGGNISFCDAVSRNITWVSYYDSSSGNYLTCKQGWTAVPCAGTTLNASQINVGRGEAIWALVNANVSYNRTVS